MAINLGKNKESLSAAWKDVLNDKTATDWAVFGYEGQTNNLKLVGSGSGGIEEMTEELNSGKIMYAFLKITDPKTSLPKCVLINWQGEGANTVRKGMCANHLRDVEKFFSGAHLTLNARNEDEVEPQLILDKVSKTGSAYSFKAPRGDFSGPTGPVGTTYKRVNPTQEINPKERDQFWLREEQEEKKRLEEEKKRREADRKRAEEELKKRELEEATRRDKVAFERNNSIDRIKQAEKDAFEHLKQKEVYVEEDIKKVNQSDLMRQQRNQEAQNLIAQRTIDARSIFEQNTAAGQIKRTPEKPVRASILKAQQAQQHSDNFREIPKVESLIETPKIEIPEMKAQSPPSDEEEEEDQFSTIKRSPRDPEKRTNATEPTLQQEIFKKEKSKADDHFKQAPNEEDVVVQQLSEQQIVDEIIYGEFNSPGLQARALFDYQAADDTEITFDPGDIITNIDQVDEGWWQGLGPDGTYGLFPANYVDLIP